MTLLSVTRLAKRFGGITAVKDLTFQVRRGSIFGIIGPNGAGKTSLFNLLTGFLPADAGSVKLNGEEVLGKKPYRLACIGLARSFQLVRPFAGMTALETLLLPGCAPHVESKRTTESHDEYAWHLLRTIGLEQKSAALSEELNQAEMRLLDIARALATRPRLLLLDEPFSGLSHNSVSMLTKILRSQRDAGMTIVIIEHRLRELMPLIDHVMVLNFGAKLAEGVPSQIVKDKSVVEAYLGIKAKHLAHSHHQ